RAEGGAQRGGGLNVTPPPDVAHIRRGVVGGERGPAPRTPPVPATAPAAVLVADYFARSKSMAL
ncbi:hypothetical protein ACH4K0_19420, partial [Streptomyces sp. NPDC017524]